MSVILDALRKLDREKSSRRNGTANIAVEILRPDLPRPGKRIPLYFVVVFFTAIATAAITYALMVEFGFLPKSSPPAPIHPPVSRQQAASTPPDSGFLPKSPPPAPVYPPVPRQQAAPAPFSREPVHDARDETSPVPPKIENPVENKSPEVSQGGKETSQPLIVEKEMVAPGNIKKPVERTPDGSVATRPSLKLSAIVWYEEPSKRFAMINGTIVTEGSVIEGVKVMEIYPTRVRFSHNGQPFEISMER